MPNWCLNALRITAKSVEHRKEVQKNLGGDVFCFENIYSTPQLLNVINNKVENFFKTGKSTKVEECWKILSDLNLGMPGDPPYHNILGPDGMVCTSNFNEKVEVLSLDEFLERQFKGISHDIRKKFIEELNTVTGRSAETLSDGLKDCLDLCDGFTNSNDWHVKHWGTKWDIEPADILEETETTLTMSFDTAWEPPVTLLEYASQLMPEAIFELSFCDPNTDLYGKLQIVNGKSKELKADRDEILEYFGLDEDFCDDEEEEDSASPAQ